MKHLKRYNDYNKTNEFLSIFKKKTEEEKFENALDKAKPIIKHNYENVFDEERKRKFYQFVKNNGFKIPEYFKYIDGQFVDAAIAVGSDIVSVNSTKSKNTQKIQENSNTCYKIGDLIFNKNVGQNGLCGLVVSDCMHDEDGHYHNVYYRGYNGDVLHTYSDEMGDITMDNIERFDKNGDISAYERIAKKRGITLNPEYKIMADVYDEEVEEFTESTNTKPKYEQDDYEDARSAIEGEFSNEKIDDSYTREEVEKLAIIISKLRKQGLDAVDVWANDNVCDYLTNLSAKYKNGKKNKKDKLVKENANNSKVKKFEDLISKLDKVESQLKKFRSDADAITPDISSKIEVLKKQKIKLRNEIGGFQLVFSKNEIDKDKFEKLVKLQKTHGTK